MFILIDGIMGSGKTYYAVNFIKENLDKYYKIYTNINGFKFNKFSNVLPLYFDYAPDGSLSLLDYFQKLKDIYDIPNTNDNDLHQYLLENDFIDSSKKPFLVVIDEAQNYFDRKTDLLIWMQTYHRHLFCDFILITQSASLLHSSYLKQFEYFIHSIPLSRQLFSNKFKYQKHIAYPYRDGKLGTKVSTITLPKSNDIFDIYQSGDKVRTKSVVNKYIYFFIGLILLVVLSFLYLFNTFFSSDSKKDTKTTNKSVTRQTNISSVKDKSKNISYNNSSNKYFVIKCLNSYCSKDYISFAFDDLEFLLKESNSKLLRFKTISNDYIILYLFVSDDFFKFFERRKQDEKSNFNVIDTVKSSFF